MKGGYNMKLRKWFKSILYLLVFVSVLFLGSDCEDTLLFFIVHFVSAVVFLISATLLIKYS